MKIKQRNNGSNRSREILDLLKDKRSLRVWILRLAGVGAVIALFFGALGYGAYLRKTGDTGYYKHALLQIADLDFSFIKKYATGQLAELDKVDIDIKFKHMLRMQYLREQALNNGMITEEQKSEEFPAKLTINGVTHDVKIALTGMMTIHLEDASKFSFEVKVKGDDTIKGMKRFGMLLPDTRGYITDWLGMELMKERGLMGLRVDFVDVNINGKPKGIFYMEERFDKYLVENNSLREGIIFKLQEDVDAYQENKLMADDGAREQLLLIKRMWQDVLAGNLELGKFLDLKKMAQAFAVTDLINNRHALYRFNLRFYFNPVTGLAEPIVREWGALHKNDPNQWSLILEQPREVGTQRYKLERDKVLKMIFDNIEFKRYYLQEIQVLSQEQFLDQFLAKNGDKLHKLVSKVYMDWPFYDLPTHFLYENQKYIQGALAPDKDHIVAYFDHQKDYQIGINIRNTQDLPVEIKRLSWRDTIFFYPTEPIILDGGHTVPPEEVQVFNFEIPPTVTWSDTLLEELKISYNLLGLDNTGESILVFPWPYEERQAHAWNPIQRDANHTSFKFIEEVPETNVITIPKGNWTLDRDLVIPAGRRLEVEAGARIDMVNQTKVICYSPVYFMGTEQDSILVHSSDKTAQGWIIIRPGERSSVEYTTFDHLNCSKEKGWGVSGAVVFYEAPVDFNAAAFIGNKIGDDFLNVIRSDFTMENSLFKDINADAFDCDFCTGTVANSSFVDVGNDGIDVSGSDIRVSHVNLVRIGDKGLSAGEGSKMVADHITITDSEIGFTSKDRSELIITDSKAVNTRIGITIFMKKSEFGPAYIQADRVQIEGAEIPYLIETNSGFVLDGAGYEANRDDVKKILYGAEFGKASVR
ncbi:MAG: CotH kinase family protein [Lewinellaceae bacterium]|nr:CotH kinase family protein [Lewinellaceae bacterium]